MEKVIILVGYNVTNLNLTKILLKIVKKKKFKIKNKVKIKIVKDDSMTLDMFNSKKF